MYEYNYAIPRTCYIIILPPGYSGPKLPAAVTVLALACPFITVRSHRLNKYTTVSSRCGTKIKINKIRYVYKSTV